MSSFRAFVYEKFGPVEEILQLREIEKEPLPASHVRVRVHSASLNPVDYKLVERGVLVNGSAPSAEKPFRIGFDSAGTIVEVGADVAGFKVGDEVYSKALRSGPGSLGEYLSIEAELVALKPRSVDFDNAAGVPGVATTSYQALVEHAKLAKGERILILGGSSSTGIFAIQFAKEIGAHVVTTTSAKNVAFIKSLGADHVIDYTTEKWSEILETHSIDVVYDCGVEPASWETSAQEVLKKETGRFVTLTPGLKASPAKYGASYTGFLVKSSGKDLAEIATLIDSGKIKLFTDSIFPFEQTVEAFTRLKTGRAVGKVIVRVHPPL